MKAIINARKIRGSWIGKPGSNYGEHIVICYNGWILGKIDPYTGKIWEMVSEIPRSFLMKAP